MPKETPGFRVVREIPKLGIRTVPMGELAFEDCRVPCWALLGREGRGAAGRRVQFMLPTLRATMKNFIVTCFLLLCAAQASAQTPAADAKLTAQVNAFVDSWHDDAAHTRMAYFEKMAPDDLNHAAGGDRRPTDEAK